ncbi:MAG: protoheme IX farnesyltransferase, partial [Planctomycetia bacterium]
SFASTPTAVLCAAASFVLYVWVYTPMKRFTAFNTAVGAVSGALPPVIGWAAATNEIGFGGLFFFLLLFAWQFPHFFAIAWMYRDDYARGGFHMLPTTERGRRVTGLQAVSYCAVLIPISVMPSVAGFAGPWYFVGAVLLGLHFLWYTASFAVDPQDNRARQLMRASLLYLPSVLLLLVLNLKPA